MRVGIDIVTTQNQDAHLGKGNYTNNIVRRMVELDPNVEFFLFRYDAPSTLDKFIYPDESLGHDTSLKPIYSNVTMVTCGQFWEGTSLRMVGLDGLWFTTQFMPKIRSYDLDVFFAPMPFRGIPIKYTKVVSVVHDVLQIPLNLYSERGPIINTIKKFEYLYDLEKIAQSDRIITDTEYSKGDLEKYMQVSGNKIEVIPLGVKDELKPAETRNSRILESYGINDRYVLYLGGVEKHKNIETLVRAFKKFVVEHSEFDHQLVLAGGGFKAENPRGRKILKLVQELDLSARVVFPGFIEEEDQEFIYSGADLYITLSLYEGFGLPPIEAMHCGTAVLASNRTTHPEILGDYSVMVNPDNITEVVDKMAAVLADDELRSKIAEEGYKHVQKYSWDNAAAQTLQTIVDLGQT